MSLPIRPTAAKVYGIWMFTSGKEMTSFSTLAAEEVFEATSLKPLAYTRPAGFLANIIRQLFPYDPMRVNAFASIPCGVLLTPRNFEAKQLQQYDNENVSADNVEITFLPPPISRKDYLWMSMRKIDSNGKNQ